MAAYLLDTINSERPPARGGLTSAVPLLVFPPKSIEIDIEQLCNQLGQYLELSIQIVCLYSHLRLVLTSGGANLRQRRSLYTKLFVT
ncbi:hypothetical protein EVAR_93104_1 [Eumeta japonica]|uniref:Uncharacterized protein n=1 Tax=Eumeta variegata TaxID=151549 RepID=A0A4C1TF39_EUMVA|nr:hypothetical protein EVAR_93104_1 [Eumeta japonica]